MSEAHARLSPSDAERWMLCAGSILRTEHLPDEESIFSAEGTAMHWFRAACLETGLDMADFVGHVFHHAEWDFEVTSEWADWIQPGIDRLREMRGAMVVEHRVDLSRWMPGQFGTLDTGIHDENLIVINDYKGGAGEQVEVENNKQLKIYALGYWDNIARHKTKATRFRLEIDQPRAGGISTWETTLDDLLAFGEEVQEAAKRTYDPDAPLHAGAKACRWCPIKTTCEEHARFVLDLFGTKFETLDDDALIGAPPVFPGKVTAERRSYIIEHASMFAGWLSGMHAEALADALAGRPTPGLKAVNGRAGPRAWKNEDEAAALLGRSLPKDKVYVQSVISPTQAEKMLKTAEWSRVKPLVTRADPKPILVPESDKREALRPIHTRFDDLEVNDLM